jgi:aspartyl protease/PDZ domain-containing protein
MCFLHIFIKIESMRLLCILILILLHGTAVSAQSGFEFDSRKQKVVIPFQLINNLVFIPINVNGIELNFLLDTGVEETILLSLEDKEHVSFHNVEKVKLRGLGSNEPIDGLKSTNNELSVNGLVDKNHNLYIVLDQSFNFSSHVGIPINGIIGYHFFKNSIVEINYDRKKIIVYRDNKKLSKKIDKRFVTVPITIERNKPYAIASVAVSEQFFPAKLLLDMGNSDALWLFDNKHDGFELPEKHFEDYLGKGFSGDITGSRARISHLKLEQFEFADPIIAFPDSTSIKSVTMVKDRVGSIGGEIFRRFTVIFDYANGKMFLKKSNHYDAKFDYNMSGIDLQNEGMQLVQENMPLETTLVGNTFDSNGEKTQNSFRYKFVLKPVYTISNIRKNSPADLCGLRKDDVIISINNTTGYRYSLQSINDLLKSEEGKWLYFEVDRKGQILKFRFQLKSML